MEAMTQKRGYPLQQVAPARISQSLPAPGSRTRSIAQKKRRAKYRRRRILALLILIAIVLSIAWGATTLVRIIWSTSHTAPMVTEEPIVAEGVMPAISAASSVSEPPAAHYALTAEERDVVERVVMAEAGGESLEGKMLVAQCILTAAEKTGLRPSDVVVKYQYTTRRPDPSQSARDAVATVFDRGEFVVDEPVMYFYNPDIVESEWHESQIFVIEVGGHRFFAERSQNNE